MAERLRPTRPAPQAPHKVKESDPLTATVWATVRVCLL
jgi:hypothetical protein